MNNTVDKKALVRSFINLSQELERVFEHLLNFARDYDEGRLLTDAFYTFFGADEQIRDRFFELGYEHYFAEWLLCDYRTAEGHSLIDLFIEPFEMFFADDEIGIMQILRDSVMSLYRIDKTSDGLFAEDMLRGQRFEIRPLGVAEYLKSDDYITARIVYCAAGYELLGSPINIPTGDIDLVIERLRDSFESFIHEYPDAEWEDFLKSLGRMLYEYLFTMVDMGIAEPPEDISVLQAPPDGTPRIDEESFEEIVDEYMIEWCDRPNPSLAGRTPRESCSDELGRKRVSKLLEDLEEIVASDQLMYGINFIGRIKKELGLSD